MKVLIVSDGKFGDRAIEVIREEYPDALMASVEPRDSSELIDEYEFDPAVEEKIQDVDLVVSYIRHPDINFELCLLGKPTIVAIYFGKGFLSQVQQDNPDVVMPLSMCGLKPDTGIPVIDEFAKHFGLPRYSIQLDPDETRIDTVKIEVQSPCGGTIESMPFLEGKLVNDKTINEFAIHVAQHCRESMSYMLSKSDSADSATVNHVMPLLDALERIAPSLFEPGGKLHEYAKEKRALVKNDGKFNPA